MFSPFLWPPCIADADIIFLPCDFYLSSIFFSAPYLSGRSFDVCHTSTHDVALVRIYNACLKCAARGSVEIQDAKKSPSAHHRTTLLGYIFTTKVHIDNRKKNLLNTNVSSTLRLIAAETCWRVWGTPANFNGFHVLAALLHGTLVVGVSQTLRC